MKHNLSLLLDLYELTMAECYYHYKKDAFATFDLLVRELPANRSYMVFAGLETVLEYLGDLSFEGPDIAFLRKKGLFSEGFLKYLASFKFKGDVWAMPEGTVFFPAEPVLRVTAPIIDAQIIESFLLCAVNLETMIATKASRIVSAAGNRKVYDFSLRRTHGPGAGIKVARSSYIAGFSGTSNVLSGRLYNMPVVGTMAHSFVMSFKRELDSFLAYASVFPDKSILLVDTYDTKEGIQNAISVGLYLKERKHRLLGIRLDSGNIAALSKYARRALDRAGLGDVKIFASGNLDEFKIEGLLKRRACVDNFGVGTNMGTSLDAPYLDVIYKISEVTDEEGNFLPTMKLSKGKVTFPGRKQVFRVTDRRGRFVRDILGLEKEKINAVPLLTKVIEKGKIIYRPPAIEAIRTSFRESLKKFRPGLKSIRSSYRYPVIISPRLRKMRQALAVGLQGVRQGNG